MARAYETDPTAFPALLKRWHRELGLTRDEAAAELRVPRSTYDGWCNGKRCEREATIRRLMDVLHQAR